jgi:predicted nucleic acid-binding protein
MDRVFLDANVLFSAAYQGSSRLLSLWKLDDAILITSRYALEEARFNLADDEQRARLTRFSDDIEFFEAGERELPHRISLPEKDAPILLAAIEARATHLLTGDVRHFGPYFGKKIEGVAVLLPGTYIKMRGR